MHSFIKRFHNSKNPAGSPINKLYFEFVPTLLRFTSSGGGRHLYIVFPDGIGRSKLTNALIEWKLGIRGTARNGNTFLKLEALATVLTQH